MFEPEEYRIVRRIKDFIKDERSLERVYAKDEGYYTFDYIMLKNGRIIGFSDYSNMVKVSSVNPQDAYVYIEIFGPSSRSNFRYPLLHIPGYLLFMYLSKLGFYYGNFVVPATGLKYIVDVEGRKGYLTIEVTNLDTMASNTNLLKIVVEVLDGKLVSGEKELTYKEYKRMLYTFNSQKLFAGHNFSEAWNIIHEYYDKGYKSLSKEVIRIAMEYERIFQPYRFCYDTRTWKEVDCLSIR